MSCPYQHAVGAYSLGTLDADERPAVAAHLRACPSCSALLSEFAGLPGLLSRVPAPEAAREPPPARLLDAVLGAARDQQRRRVRRRRLVAVAASLVLLAGAGSAAVLADRSAEPVSVQAAQGGVRAEVTVADGPEGAELALRLSGVPPGETCRLVAVAADGSRDVTSSWQATYVGTAEVTGHSRLDPADIDVLVVETGDGRTLLELPLTRS